MTTIPNILTILRCLGVFALAVLLVWPFGDVRLAALIVFVLAALTDWLDGYLARKLNQISAFGRMLDSIADKLLVGVALLMLCAEGTIGGLNSLAAALILMREIAISGLREHLGTKGIVVPASLFAKWKTTIQLVAIAVLIGAPLTWAPATFVVIGLVILWAAVVMTLVSGWQYIWGTRKAWGEEA
ncbi:CDP-diacylglycerol--glycerol-3-phosphate 3-phosphatidyltransferase [Acuticoccus sp. M5D2P5]|uniref:CDP-diacylglycerol--glycerol-3-phosphate 3-phosphatidyltransferase n=1 Tax=Acuticoccus kalidii TaxID=2910977 RepID=UPI001F2F69CA|nr:CDP-diacylglycerol--glycerol-3-phosphate 3-phosphatidyltransferase [Acuticoccus kalidii]MCF3932162.1 CDP-diacylglycerol--glycerol-3-phosphate 3-phosphatidyltransferase [Acuticoccus kalidii]